MNLLPKSHEEFSQKEYWDSFFKKRGPEAFEWYGEYPELSEHLHKYIKQQDDILITGCGNSTLGRDLFDIGYSKITNIDISQVVIRQMLSQNEKERPTLKYLQMDALAMSFHEDNFSVVLDKGTLDALMPNEQEDTLSKIQQYFTEITRILRIGGRFICITLLQEHILKALLNYFPQNNCMFRIVRCFEAEKKAADNGENAMPVFMVICTKFKAIPRLILELNLSSTDKMLRFETIEEITKQITNAQQAAFICTGLKRTSLGDEHEVCLDLHQADQSKPRFTIYVVDAKPKVKSLQYAAFIVPQGREAEWLFSTKKGRQQLTEMTQTKRLAIVTMHRGQNYGNFQQVQDELSDAVCNLSPADLRNRKIPFLSLGSDVGERIVRLEDTSAFSGDYVVEDVEIDNEKFRRLFYLKTQLVIQSEAKLRTIKNKKGTRKEVADLAHLTCKHHIYMSISTFLACAEKHNASIAVVGLGGGGLCSFLRKFLPNISITGVDIDESMLKVATDWFGLVQDSNLKVVIQDGLHFLEENKEQFDAILFDVDSKDSSIGLSCPPKQFLEDSVLKNVSRLIGNSGLFVLNLVLRDETLRPTICMNLKTHFKSVISYKLEEDLNEIFICTIAHLKSDIINPKLSKAVAQINNFFRKHNTNQNDHIDVNDYLKSLVHQ